MSNYTVKPAGEKPQLVMTIAIMTLVSGILNILWGLGLTAAIVLGTFLLGIVCAPVTILPAILGLFEVIYAAKLLSNPPQRVQPSQAIAIMEIISSFSGNVISLIIGILSLIFYNDATVKNYFAEINGQIVPPAPPVTPEPAAPPEAITPKKPAPKPKSAKKIAKPKAEPTKKTEKTAKPKTPKKPTKPKKTKAEVSSADTKSE